MLLFDTSALIELERELAEFRIGEARVFLARRRGEDLACSTVSIGELAAGEEETAVRVLLRRLRRIPLSEAIAYRAGALEQRLSRAGCQLGENDNWIAATALHYSATLVYSDGDFDRVDEIKRIRI